MANPTETVTLEARINTFGLVLGFGVPLVITAVIWLVLEPYRTANPPRQAAETVHYALLAIALIELPLGFVLKRFTLSGQLKPRFNVVVPSTPRGIALRAYLIGFASVAAAAFYAIPLHLLGGSTTWAMAMQLIPPIGYLLLRPRGDELEEALNRLST